MQNHPATKQIGNYYLTSKVLGKGQFGEVVLAKEDTGNSQPKWLACKIIKKQNMSARFQINLKSEIGILSKIKSSNVIELYDIQKTMNNFYLFMEFCNGGDLDTLREIRGRFTEEEARYYLTQIMNGFKAISDMNVIHRDLKLANILVNFSDVDVQFALDGGE